MDTPLSLKVFCQQLAENTYEQLQNEFSALWDRCKGLWDDMWTSFPTGWIPPLQSNTHPARFLYQLILELSSFPGVMRRVVLRAIAAATARSVEWPRELHHKVLPVDVACQAIVEMLLIEGVKQITDPPLWWLRFTTRVKEIIDWPAKWRALFKIQFLSVLMGRIFSVVEFVVQTLFQGLGLIILLMILIEFLRRVNNRTERESLLKHLQQMTPRRCVKSEMGTIRRRMVGGVKP